MAMVSMNCIQEGRTYPTPANNSNTSKARNNKALSGMV
jgi:hypothetical protein